MRVTTAVADRRYDQAVSDMPPPTSAPPGSHPWLPPTPLAQSRQWPAFALLIIALIPTLGVAIVGWFRPAPPKPSQPPTYTKEQIADAKAKVCSIYEQVRKAVVANTTRNGGDDPTATLAVAANARAALYNGGDYLSKALAQEPSTPPELAKAIHTLVNSYQKLAIDYLSEAPDSEQQLSRDAVSNDGTAVYGFCK
jgi:hypothetical protein